MNTDKYVKGRLIAHAGGNIATRKYTNCCEALEASRKHVDLLEFDVCRASNGLIVAHDGLENRYGVNGKFADLTVEEFSSLRYLSIFHTMSLRDLISRLSESQASIVLDIKSESAAEYAYALKKIVEYCEEYYVCEKVIVQVYSPDDISCAQSLGVENIILALWKNYYDVRTKKCRDCIELCFKSEVRGFRALSMRSIYFWEAGVSAGEDIIDYLFEQSPMIFLHGQSIDIEEKLLRSGFGLYTHDPQKLVPLLATL